MSFRAEELGLDDLENFISPPLSWEQSLEATHWVSITLPGGDAQAELRYDYAPSGDVIVLDVCEPLHSDLPYREGSEVLTNLSHKTLLRVDSERVGPGGAWHFVTIVDTNPQIDGMVGYVAQANIKRLPNTPESLPMVFDTCLEKTAAQVQDLCSLNTPRWYVTDGPYYDAIACEYKVSVTTDYYDTGGEALESRMSAQAPRGAYEILEYYDKKRSQGDLDRYFSAFQFAKAASWHLDVTSQSQSRLKVLVSIEAKYLNAIEPAPRQIDTRDMAGTIILNSSQLKTQIDSLSDMMNRYQSKNSWKNVSYAGPEPEYSDFSFKREASNLRLWLSNFNRILSINGISLRANSRDTFEIGHDDQYRIKYITATVDGLGARDIRIGFSRYLRQNPNNNVRTIAYLSRINQIYNISRRSGEMPGGWISLINDYTLPKPRKVKNTSKKNKRCVSGADCFEEKLKALGGEWDDFLKGRNWHKLDLKCDSISPERRFYLTPVGRTPTLFDAAKSGELDNYKNQFAPAKTETYAEIERQDGQRWISQLAHNLDLPSYDYTGDPFAAELRELLLEVFDQSGRGILGGGSNRPSPETYDYLGELEGEGRPSALLQSTGDELLNKVVYDVATKVDLKGKIRELINCLCAQIEQAAVNIEYAAQGEIVANPTFGLRTAGKEYVDSQALADGLRATAAALGCGNICGVVPMLCACLPFEWPIRIKIPDNLPTVDIMAYITTLIISAIIDTIIQFLVNLIASLLNFGIGKLCHIKSEDQEFNLQYNRQFTDEAVAELANLLEKNNLPPDAIDPDVMQRLLKHTATILLPREFCELVSGEANTDVLQIVDGLIRESYPDVYARFSTVERIRSLYIMLGELLDQDICRNLADIIDSTNVDASNYICENTDLRQSIVDGRATKAQILEMLEEAATCDAKKLENVINIATQLASGEDFSDALLPNIFSTPSNPDGIIPREPPSVKFLADIARDNVFTPIESRFIGDLNSNIPTIITNDAVVEEEPDQNQPFYGVFGAYPGAGQAVKQYVRTVAGNLDGWLMGERGDIVHVNFSTDGASHESVITLRLPTRNIYPPINASSLAAASNAYSHLGSLGYPAIANPDITAPLGQKNTTLYYNICKPTAPGLRWSRVLDSYTVQMREQAEGTIASTITFDFDGEKVISPEVVSVLESDSTGGDIRGIAPPPAEAFLNYIKAKWLSIPSELLGSELRASLFKDVYLESDEFDTLHADLLFKLVTEGIVDSIAETIANTELLSAPEFLERKLSEYQFAPNPACSPRAPGLLGVDSVRAIIAQVAGSSELPDPQRNIFALTYGLSLIFIKVYVAEFFLNGIFPFSKFRVQDLLTSDMIVKYFLNRMKENSGISEHQYEGAFVEDQLSDFYGEIIFSVNRVLRDRKYNQDRKFTDPITNEPVEVLLLGEDSDSGFNISDIGRLIAGHTPLESTRDCSSGVAEFDIDCLPTSVAAALNEFAIQIYDSETGNRVLGFMEYIIREQLKSVGDEFEAIVGTEVLDLNSHTLKNIIQNTDVPANAPRGPTRFFKNFSDAFGVEGSLAITSRSLRELGFARLSDLYYVYERLLHFHSQSRCRSNLPRLRGMDRLAGGCQQELLSDGRFVEIVDRELLKLSGQAPPGRPNGPYLLETEVQRLPLEQQNITQVVSQAYPPLEKMRQFFADEFSATLEEVLERLAQGDVGELLKDRFDYLSSGGFILERFIKVNDYSEEEWSRIREDLGEQGELAYGIIRNRRVSQIDDISDALYGLVNIDVWNQWLNSILPQQEQLGIFAENVVSGDFYFDIEKYFKSWEFGVRLTYVYPIEDNSQEDWAPNVKDFNQVFDGLFFEGERPHPETLDLVKANRAYGLVEDINFNNNLIVPTLEFNDVIEEQFETIEVRPARSTRVVRTLPLIQKTLPVSRNFLQTPPLPTNTSVVIQTCIDIIEANFLGSIRERYEELAKEFNNLIIPPGDPRRASDSTTAFYFNGVGKPWTSQRYDDPRDGRIRTYEEGRILRSVPFDDDINSQWDHRHWLLGPYLTISEIDGLPGRGIDDLPGPIEPSLAFFESITRTERSFHILGPDGRGTIDASVVKQAIQSSGYDFVLNGVPLFEHPMTSMDTGLYTNFVSTMYSYWLANRINDLAKDLFGFSVIGACLYPYDYGRPQLFDDYAFPATLVRENFLFATPRIRLDSGLHMPAGMVQTLNISDSERQLFKYPTHPGFVPKTHPKGFLNRGQQYAIDWPYWLASRTQPYNYEQAGEILALHGYPHDDIIQNPNLWANHYINLSDFFTGYRNFEDGRAWSERRSIFIDEPEDAQSWLFGWLYRGHEQNSDAFDPRSLAEPEDDQDPQYEQDVGGFMDVYERNLLHLSPNTEETIGGIDLGIRHVYRYLVDEYLTPLQQLLERSDELPPDITLLRQEDLAIRLHDEEQTIEYQLFHTIQKIHDLLEGQRTAYLQDGSTPTTRCLIDRNPDNVVFENQIPPEIGGDCSLLLNMHTGMIQTRFFMDKINGADARLLLIDLNATYYRNYEAQLKTEMARDAEYRALFEYMYPMARFTSLMTIYNVEHVSNLPGRKEMFDETRTLIKLLYSTFRGGERDDWWARKPMPRNKWWQRSHDLPIPLLIFMTPWKILEMLFEVVPPLKWLLDFIRIPKLPPYGGSGGDPGCDT